MARTHTGYLNRLADQSAERRWARIASVADDIPLESLQKIRNRAQSLQAQTARVIACADERLSRPRSGISSLRDTLGADWAFRPDAWRGAMVPMGAASLRSGDWFGDTIKVFHDCPLNENVLRQVRNTGASDLAPFGLRVDVMGFEGSYLSLVVDLPDAALTALSRRHLIRLGIELDAESPVQAYARLNIKNGPNTAQTTESLTPGRQATAEFDLGYMDFNEAVVEGAWVELIFERPVMNQIIIRDFTVSRRQRAEL